MTKASVLILTLLVVLVLFFVGCSFIGYTAGDVIDSETASVSPIVDVSTLKVDQSILIRWKNGRKNFGKVSAVSADGVQITYVAGDYQIRTTLKELEARGEAEKIVRLEKSHTGRRIGTTLGVLFDLIFLFSIFWAAHFTAPGN